MTDLEYRHPYYEANIDRWNYYRASYAGGFDYRNQSLGMLTFFNRMDSGYMTSFSMSCSYITVSFSTVPLIFMVFH